MYNIKLSGYYNWNIGDDFKMKPHSHPTMEVMYVISGSLGILVIHDDQTSVNTLHAGQYIFINEGTMHCIVPPQGRHSSFKIARGKVSVFKKCGIK